MKKEKTIRTYQRKTKSGKITTVKSHTAKYDAAAEVAKKAARKKGAGGELQAKLTKMPDPKLELQQYLDELKKSRSGASSDTAKTTKPAPKKKLKKPVGGGITGLEPRETKKAPAKKQTKPAPKSSGLSSTEFKAWYHDPKSKEGRAAAKKLKEQVGAEKYKELNKKANDSYSSRGHISLFKSIGSDSTSKAAPKKPLKKPVGGGITGLEPNKKTTKVKSSSNSSKNAASKSSDTFSDLKGLHRVLKYNEFKDAEPKSLTGTKRNSALKILKANGYKKVADYWVPPKGKGNTYTDYKGSLFQTDSDSKRDLYSGHTFLSSSQYKTLTELGYKKR